MRKLCPLLAIVILILPPAHAPDATLILDTWREGDQSAWTTILTDFQKDHPEISIIYRASPASSYDGDINLKLRNGNAGDLIACRPFDSSKTLFLNGNLTPLGNLPGIDGFTDEARHPWEATDGTPYCVPVAFVLYAFAYNKSYFADHNLIEPRSYEDLQTLLTTLKTQNVIPLALSSKDGTSVTSDAFDSVGVNFWNGEIGRLGLMAGTQKYTSNGFLNAFKTLSSWQPYLPFGNATLSEEDTQSLFLSGKAILYPVPSNALPALEKASFALDIFRSPAPRSNGSVCWIETNPEIGIGLNPLSPHLDAARALLTYMTTERFASLYAQLLPGYFPLQTQAGKNLSTNDPLLNRFLAFRNTCQTTLPPELERLNANPDHPLKADLARVNSLLLQGAITPEDAAAVVQKSLDKWYVP